MKNPNSDINTVKVSKKITPVGIGIPVELNEIAEECSFKLTTCEYWNQVGQGAAGKVYIREGDSKYALKIQKANCIFFAEMKALTDLQKILKDEVKGVVPKLYASWICNGNGYILIEKLYDSYGMRSKEMQYALKKIEEYGWLHLDISTCNRMSNRDGNLVLIDFGWAVKKPSDDNKTYPYHPISIKSCKAFTYADLKIRQDADFNMIYSKYLDEEEYIPVMYTPKPVNKPNSSCIII
jgi:serine/threonine protein kinase